MSITYYEHMELISKKSWHERSTLDEFKWIEDTPLVQRKTQRRKELVANCETIFSKLQHEEIFKDTLKSFGHSKKTDILVLEDKSKDLKKYKLKMEHWLLRMS